MDGAAIRRQRISRTAFRAADRIKPRQAFRGRERREPFRVVALKVVKAHDVERVVEAVDEEERVNGSLNPHAIQNRGVERAVVVRRASRPR